MLRNPGGIWFKVIIFGDNICPGHFAGSIEAEPGPEKREPVNCFNLISHSRYFLRHKFHAHHPGLIMLGTFVRHCISRLLRDTFLCYIFCIFQALGFHTYIIQYFRICTEIVNEVFLHIMGSLPGYLSEAFTVSYLMNKLNGSILVPEG